MRRLGWLLLVGCAAVPARASAYAVQTSHTGAPLHWLAPAGQPAQVTVRRDSSSPSRWLDDQAVSAALDGALATWSATPSATTAPVVLAQGAPGPAPSSAPEEVWLRFVQKGWPYPSAQLASTLLYARDHSGEITGAIIEVNEDEHAFEAIDGDGDTADRRGNYDLQTVLTHEIGHLVGLAHSTDAHATMFPSTAPDDTQQRHPDADDVTGLLSLYPTAAPSPTPSPLGPPSSATSPGALPSSVGCQAAPGRPSRAPLALVAVLAAFLLRLRRHV